MCVCVCLFIYLYIHLYIHMHVWSYMYIYRCLQLFHHGFSLCIWTDVQPGCRNPFQTGPEKPWVSASRKVGPACAQPGLSGRSWPHRDQNSIPSAIKVTWVIHQDTQSGWCFGTCFIFPYIGNNHPNWLIFFRGVESTSQQWFEYDIDAGILKTAYLRSWEMVY